MSTTLTVDGAVATPLSLSFEQLTALEQVDVGALISGKEGKGVRLRALLAASGATASARYATLASADGTFAISVPLADIADNALVAYALGGAPLPATKGGPVRFYVVDAKACRTGEVDACANVKGLGRITLTAEKQPDVGHAHPR